MRLLAFQFILYILVRLGFAQFPPKPQNVTIKHVTNHPGVSISYKETWICETTARAFAGYVHMPTSYLRDIETSDPYNISMFFWYFEARNNPRNAPTTIYLAGGPGVASSYDATLQGGPCTILSDSNSTTPNPWSLNEYTNVLYVDQPVGTGFSYDTLINSTLDLLYLGDPPETGITPFEAYNGSVPAQNSTFIYGVLPSQNPAKTANTTATAVRTLWLFSQAWFSSFPEYNTTDHRIGYWGNSYGGYWVPAAAAYTVAQNTRIAAHELPDALFLPVDTIGFTNGCVDLLSQAAGWPQMAYNNTYDTPIISHEDFVSASENVTRPAGCLDQIRRCRALGSRYDPAFLALNDSVNAICAEALGYCEEFVAGVFDRVSNRSDFDLAQLKPAPWPPSSPQGFFNQAWVQAALGVPVNFTGDSLVVNDVFVYTTGDAVRTAGVPALEFLLASGVKVALVYGDRDYRCPWTGGEALSLGVEWAQAARFREAGYAEIRTNASYVGGVVRQVGNLSFSRVFESGHDAAWYQPETVFRIFNRAFFNTDIATGMISTTGANGNYSTCGPLSSYGWKNTLPPPPADDCYLLDVASTCTIQQYEALMNGTAEVDDYNVVKPAGGSPGSIIGVF